MQDKHSTQASQMVFENDKGGKHQYDSSENKFTQSPYENRSPTDECLASNESPADIIIENSSLVRESLYSDAVVPNENWSQVKKSNEAETPQSPQDGQFVIDTEMVDEEDDSACWNGMQSQTHS